MLSIWEISLTGGLLIAAVLLVRAAGSRRLPKAVLPVLWWTALCRLLLPFRLPSPTSVYAAAGQLGVGQLRPGLLLDAAGGEASAETAAVQTALSPELAALLLWGCAALGLALCFLIPHLRCMGRCRCSLPEESAFVKAWMARHPLRRPVRVRSSDRIDAPFTCGVIRPAIFLPKALDRDDPDKLAFVLAHELAHIRRWDALTKGLLALCLCIHWFNPLVWVMYLLAGRDLELACDEAVLRQYGPAARADYALTLVALEEKRARFAPLCSGFAKNALEERIVAIMKHKKLTAAGIGAAAVLAAVLVAVFATNPPAPAEQHAGVTAQSARYYPGQIQISTDPKGAITTAVVEDVAMGTGIWDGWDGVSPNYTQAQYDLVIRRLKLDGWQEMSIAEFNRTLNARFQGEDSGARESEDFWMAYEMVLSTLPEDDENAAYLCNTVQASRNEYQARLEEVYSNKRSDPSFTGTAQKRQEADVFGEMVQTAYAYAYYNFTYQILDQDQLTVAARDQFLQDVMSGAQTYLDGLTMGQIIDDKDAEASFKTALEAAGAAASTDYIKFTGCTVNGFEGYYAGY